MIESRSVLVAGGAGYIGSHCCKALSDEGFKPICFDNLSSGHRDFVRWGPLVVGDIHDVDLVEQTLRTNNVVAVMHFAASSMVGESVIDPEKYYTNNTVGTLSLLRAMRNADCSRLVFSSTGAVYGETSAGLIREDASCMPVNPYGSSKHMIEQILADYQRAYQLNSFALRYFNASGADKSGQLGELRDPETHLIPRALMALQGHVSDFAVYGTDYDTPDGTAVRDYIHVADLAAAHVSALRLLLQGHRGGRFNLGTGVGLSVAEILSAITRVTGRQVPLTYKSRRPGDPAFLVADASAAQQTLDFKPQHSDIDTIVGDAWKWHQTAHQAR